MSLPTLLTPPLSETRLNGEPISLVWLDLHCHSTPLIIASLRSVNDFIRIYNDAFTCFEESKSSASQIFLLLPSGKEDLIVQFHVLDQVEAMFILDPKAIPIEQDFPKLIGCFKQHDELIPSLKYLIDQYQQVRLGTFAFDDEDAFLWLQLWKDEVRSRTSSSLLKIVFVVDDEKSSAEQSKGISRHGSSLLSESFATTSMRR